MMGIASNNKSENPEAGELIDYWADKYMTIKLYYWANSLCRSKKYCIDI